MLTAHTLHPLSHHHHHRGSTVPELEKQTNLNTLISEINGNVALFRDMLMHIGQSKDSPELREKVRKLRRQTIDACKHTAQILLNQIKSALASSDIPVDNPHLVLFFYLLQLFLRELIKSYRLIQVVPMDMSGYYENRAGPNLGNVLSQLLLCKTIKPDFNQEELCSITKDSEEISALIDELQEYMPKHDACMERATALEANITWTAKAKSFDFCENMKILCCLSRKSFP